MAQDSSLQSKAFSFIKVAPRPSKPRDQGLTIVADRGLGMNRIDDIAEASGDYIDYFKIAIGAWRLQSEAFLKKKIAALNKAKINTFFKKASRRSLLPSLGQVTISELMRMVPTSRSGTIPDAIFNQYRASLS